MQVTQPTPADWPLASCSDGHRRTGHIPDAEPFERLHGLNPVIALRVEPPLRLVDALVVQQEVTALLTRRPAVIVLDVAGVVPVDEMGVLALSAVAHDAAEQGSAVVLAYPSRPLRDRLAQLGVRDVTFIYPSEPAEGESEHMVDHRHIPLAASDPETFERPTRSGLAPAHVGTTFVAET
jgi:anti-anti-sigma regulatory factor